MAVRNAFRALIGFALWVAALGPAFAQSDTGEASIGPYYPAEALNAGLPPAATPPVLATPQSSLENLLLAGRREAFARAARSLNLALVPEAQQADQAPRLARKLYYLLDRKISIDWADIPDRPDGKRAAAPGEQSPPEARRTVRLGSIDLDGRAIPVNLQRFKPGEGDAVWLVSPFTVEHIDALYAEHGPGFLERRLPEWAKIRAGDVAVWEWGVLVVVGVVSGLFGWGFQRLITAWLSRTSRPWLRRVSDDLDVPLVLFLSLILFSALVFATLPLRGPITGLLQPILIAATILAGAWVAMRSVNALGDWVGSHYHDRVGDESDGRARQLLTQVQVAKRVVMLLVFAVAVGVVLSYFKLFEVVGLSLLASAGAVTVILGVAARNVLGNLISGIQIALAQPARIGHTVKFDGEWGTIEDITFTYVVLKIWNERRYIIPHSVFLSQPFENWSKTEAATKMTVYLYCDHAVDVDAVRAKYEELIEANDKWNGRDRRLEVLDVGEETVALRVVCAAETASDAWALHVEIREGLLKFLQSHDGGRALPQDRVMLTRVAAGDDETPVTSTRQTKDRQRTAETS